MIKPQPRNTESRLWNQPLNAIEKRRCAIYTRKSSEQGLDLAVNSLDTQRELCQAYIQAQSEWECLPTHYDDGGFTGGNTERPALRQLMSDIESGLIDCVVVYKIDRLSRSLMDFSQLMHQFEEHNVTFVSVTQQFNTTTAMGKLMLAILTSFSAYERELISERTRDKIADTRRKGFWTGGRPILGYDVERSHAGSRLVVNTLEAEQVQSIFKLYLEKQSLLATVKELKHRGWTTKLWITKKGKTLGGSEFSKNTLHAMLCNPLYAGKIRYKDEVHPAVHKAIIDQSLWNEVQSTLKRHGQIGRPVTHTERHGILSGLLRCGHCQSSLIHTYTQKGKTQYRYYKCLKIQKQGSGACPSSAIAAGKLEAYIVNQINRLGHDLELQDAVIQSIHNQPEDGDTLEQKTHESLNQQLDEARKRWLYLTQNPVQDEGHTEELTQVEHQMQQLERELRELTSQLESKNPPRLTQQRASQIRALLEDFESLWSSLTLSEQSTLLKNLFHQITITKHGNSHEIAMSFHQDVMSLLHPDNQGESKT